MIYEGPGKPAVILLFSVFADDFNLQERLIPVGNAYNLPMVSVKNSVTDQFYLKKETGRVISKAQYFYDCFHPTNVGHTIMADGIINLMKVVDASPYDDTETDISVIKPPIGGEFQNIKLIDKKQVSDVAVICEGDFNETDTELQAVEMDMNLLPKVKIEIVVSLVPVEKVIETAKAVLHTGKIGDGKVFVYDIENVVKIRTGEEGFQALQDTAE